MLFLSHWLPLRLIELREHRDNGLLIQYVGTQLVRPDLVGHMNTAHPDQTEFDLIQMGKDPVLKCNSVLPTPRESYG